MQGGCVGSNGRGNFTYEIETSNGEKLFEGDFNPELIFTDSPSENNQEINGETYTSDVNFYLKIPTINNAKTLKIVQNQNILVETSLNDIGGIPCAI